MIVPFPEAAVGVGAQWTATRTIALSGIANLGLNGIASEQVATFEVVERTADSVTLAVRLTGSAPPQTLPHPLGGEAIFYLNAMTLTGTGTSRIALDSFVPTASLATTAATIVSLAQDEQRVPRVTAKTEMTLRIRSAAAE